MQSRVLRANILLLITAAVWGSGFIAQRTGMDYVGPFIFNGLRFAIGSIWLIPFVMWSSRRHTPRPPGDKGNSKFALTGMLLAGTVLFLGVGLQQIGLVTATAGNAGFITGLYVVIVPMLALLLGQSPGVGGIVGAVIAAVGLFLLSVTDEFTMATGDLWVLGSTLFWAIHVIVLGWLSPRMDSVKLALGQFAVCSILNFIFAFIIEEVTWASIVSGWIPIVYGGIMPVGIAYTLQVIAQKDATPTHTVVILSLEAVFAALGGWMLLDETMTTRGFFGCFLMLGGMLVTQLWPNRKSEA